MAGRTKIEWSEMSWNPLQGCSRVSGGCKNCFAEELAARFSNPGNWGEGLARFVTRPDGKREPRWTGVVRPAPDAVLLKPLSWRKPRLIFVNSTSDLFHESVPDDVIDRVFAVMALCPQHTFQVLTKRPARMRAYFSGIDNGDGERLVGIEWRSALIEGMAQKIHAERTGEDPSEWLAVNMPLPNVWLGVSVEDQPTADLRIPEILATPAAVRFVSAEPLLGRLDIGWALSSNRMDIAAGFLKLGQFAPGLETLRPLDLVIVGGESGLRARPMHPDWAREIRDQCAAAGVKHFFKQWGDWLPSSHADHLGDQIDGCVLGEFHDGGEDWIEGCMCAEGDPDMPMFRVGKKAAGRKLDGVLHDALPEIGIPDRGPGQGAV